MKNYASFENWNAIAVSKKLTLNIKYDTTNYQRGGVHLTKNWL